MGPEFPGANPNSQDTSNGTPINASNGINILSTEQLRSVPISPVPFSSHILSSKYEELNAALEAGKLPQVQSNAAKFSVTIGTQGEIQGVRLSQYLWGLAHEQLFKTGQANGDTSPRHLGAGLYGFFNDPELGLCQLCHVKGQNIIGGGALHPILFGGYVEDLDLTQGGGRVDISTLLSTARRREEAEEFFGASGLVRPTGSVMTLDEVETGNFPVQTIAQIPTNLLRDEQERNKFLRLLQIHSAAKNITAPDIEALVIVPWMTSDTHRSDSRYTIEGPIRLADLQPYKGIARPQMVQLLNASALLAPRISSLIESA